MIFEHKERALDLLGVGKYLGNSIFKEALQSFNFADLYSFLVGFEDVYDYCRFFYGLEREFVDRMIEEGKRAITVDEDLRRYIELAKDFWQLQVNIIEEKEKRFNTVKEKNKGHHENYNGVIAYKTLTEVKKMGMNGENGSNLYEDLQRKSRGKKSLIIVCDEKTVKYGNYLGQLISTNDDKEGDVVGVVDGTVEVAVWTEKEYKANKVKIPFSQHVIFIGENEVSKEETSSIPVLFDKFGMQYGWLGKRAKVNVTKGWLSAQEYNDFIQYCLGYQSKFDNAIMKTKIAGLDLKELEKMQDDPEKLKGLFAEQIKKETPKTQLKKLLPNLDLYLCPVVGPLAVTAVAAKTGVDIANSIKEVVDQQYRAVTSILYIEGLQSFLEG